MGCNGWCLTEFTSLSDSGQNQLTKQAQSEGISKGNAHDPFSPDAVPFLGPKLCCGLSLVPCLVSIPYPAVAGLVLTTPSYIYG